MKTYLIALALLVSMGVPASAASFNCDLAKLPTEVLICKDDELTIKDEINAKLFFMVRNTISDDKTRTMFNRSERTWLKERNACGYDHRCVSDSYDAHIPGLWKLLPSDVALDMCSTGDGSFIAQCNALAGRSSEDAPCVSSFAKRTSEGYVSMRDGPGVSHTRIAKLRPGDSLGVSRDVRGDWVYVESVNDGETAEHGELLAGWVHSNLIVQGPCPTEM